MPPFPNSPAFTLTNATVPDSATGDAASGAVRRYDIEVRNGVVEDIRPAGGIPVSGPAYDLDSGIVMPCFVDVHTHLDKGHIWARKENPHGTWMGALLAVIEDREALWVAADVERRMDFALRCAYAHGTAAIRTHIDSVPPQHEISWALFEAMRDRWAGRVELQAVSLYGPDVMRDPAALDEIARIVKLTGGILGGSVADGEGARAAIFAVVEKAGDLGLELDLHIDETLEPNAVSLRHLADAVVETGYEGRVLAGHCCSLSAQDEYQAQETIAKVVEAGISVVSLPICNIYLMDRHNENGVVRTPRYRGVTLLNELRAAGVKVAVASDNTRDPFYAYGDLDMVEVFREAARVLHFDHPQRSAWCWGATVGSGAAEIGGFDYRARIQPGAPADLVLLRARTWTELNARPQSDRIVLRAGQAIDTTPPDYRELDDLMGMPQ
jgi:cytosine deaminase